MVQGHLVVRRHSIHLERHLLFAKLALVVLLPQLNWRNSHWILLLVIQFERQHFNYVFFHLLLD